MVSFVVYCVIVLYFLFIFIFIIVWFGEFLEVELLDDVFFDFVCIRIID